MIQTLFTLKEWHVFSGNELGTLLGHWQWKKYCDKKAAGEATKPAVMLASTVSSKQLRALATMEGSHPNCTHKHNPNSDLNHNPNHVKGFQFEETLTGFKWMGNRTEVLREQGKAEFLLNRNPEQSPQLVRL